jgi:OOP family OmpA-OmpF porin
MLTIRRCVVSLLLALASSPSLRAAELVDVLALAEGTVVVVEPGSFSGWEPYNVIDAAPTSGWASETGKVGEVVFVFELLAPATIERFAFDTAAIDGDGRGAKDVVVEVAAESARGPFTEVLRATLADRADDQRFPAAQRVTGRFVRLTVRNNHGDPEWSELMGMRGFAVRPAPSASALQVSGTYATTYGNFHLRQQGSALVGCYDHNEGLLSGTVEGRVMKLTWSEGTDRSAFGPAVMVVAADGSGFRGHWWQGSDADTAPAGTWDGKKTSPTPGRCEHWSGSVGGEVARDLAGAGRARLYGILFDLDRATLRPESRQVLDEIVALLGQHPDWEITIEGHTDASGTAARNDVLSKERAAAVRDYLVAQGIAAARLTAAGLGARQPVADNATELGRAQNRRVELVRSE